MLCSVLKERTAASESSQLRQEKTCELGNVERLSCWRSRRRTKQLEITDNSEELERNLTVEPPHCHITGIFCLFSLPTFLPGKVKLNSSFFLLFHCSFLFSHTVSLISDSFYIPPDCLPLKQGIQDYLGVCHRALDGEMMCMHLVQQPQLVNQVSVLLTLMISFLKFILEEVV